MNSKSDFFWTRNSWLPAPPSRLFIGAETSRGLLQDAQIMRALETCTKRSGSMRSTFL